MDAILVDLSGTLHVDDVTTPNSIAALERYDAYKDYFLFHPIMTH